MPNENKKKPLIIFDENASSFKKIIPFICIAILAIALYFSGIVFVKSGITMAGLILLALNIIAYLIYKRKTKSQKEILKSIEKETEQFKQDLVNTYVGYEIKYEPEDIKSAAKKYQKQLEENETSISDFSPKTAIEILKSAKTKPNKKDI